MAALLAAWLLACSPADSPNGAGDPGVGQADLRGGPPGGEPDPSASPAGVAAGAPARRGVWVLAEGSVRVLDDPSRIPSLLDRAVELGASDLFVQVYRGGRVF